MKFTYAYYITISCMCKNITVNHLKIWSANIRIGQSKCEGKYLIMRWHVVDDIQMMEIGKYGKYGAMPYKDCESFFGVKSVF